MISPAAIREISKLQHEANQLLSKRDITRGDGKRADLLLGQIATIKQTGFSSLELRQVLANELGREMGVAPTDFDKYTPEERAHQAIFSKFLRGRDDDETLRTELRTNPAFLAGYSAISYEDGPEGGFLVPQQFREQVMEAVAAVDPLFDEDVSTLVQEDSFKLPQLTVPGFDLSTFTAVKVAEATQQNPQVIPAADTKLMSRWMYRASLAASIEFEEDNRAYGSTEAAMARAFGVAFGRGVGVDTISGDGVTGPQGALTGAVNSGVTTAVADVLMADDFTNIFFSVNKIYRNSPKCAWVMNDATYKLARQAVDSNQRPLINMVGDKEQILGKPVLISPTMPAGAGQQAILFGDFSHYVIHASRPFIRRRINTPGIVEYGLALFTALLMIDAVVRDPSDGENGGAYSPIKYATLRAS